MDCRVRLTFAARIDECKNKCERGLCHVQLSVFGCNYKSFWRRALRSLHNDQSHSPVDRRARSYQRKLKCQGYSIRGHISCLTRKLSQSSGHKCLGTVSLKLLHSANRKYLRWASVMVGTESRTILAQELRANRVSAGLISMTMCNLHAIDVGSFPCSG